MIIILMVNHVIEISDHKIDDNINIHASSVPRQSVTCKLS